MINNDLQKMVLRSLVAFYAEDGGDNHDGLEKDFLVSGILGTGLALSKDACYQAMNDLLASSILQNGYGSKVSLTGGGLILAMGTRLTNEVEEALYASFLRLGEEASSGKD